MLQDEHLKTALRHAPDRDVLPSRRVRDNVLQYAKKTSAPQQNVLQRLLHWLRHHKLSQVHWAGAASAATVILVVFMAWQQHPEDSVWITAGTDKQNTAHTEMAATPATTDQIAEISPAASPEAAPASAPLALEKLGESAQSEPSGMQNKENSADNQVTAKRQHQSVIIGELAEYDSHSKAAKNVVPETDQAKASSEAPAEQRGQLESSPATITAAQQSLPENQLDQPASKPAPQTANNDAGNNDLGNQNFEIIAKPDAHTKRKQTVEDAEDKLGRHTPAESAPDQMAGSDALVAQLISRGGHQVANQDIQMGALRLLNVVVHPTANQQNCAFKPLSTANIDATTGLRVENIDICRTSESLKIEVEHYNNTMKNWYLQYQAE